MYMATINDSSLNVKIVFLMSTSRLREQTTINEIILIIDIVRQNISPLYCLFHSKQKDRNLI